MEREDVKWMDLNEFRNGGFLQEVNRQFFHPLGLALAVDVDDSGNVIGLAGLWDYRDDPEGVVFGPGMIDPNKIAAVDQQRRAHWATRSNMFKSKVAFNTYADVQPHDWVDDGEDRDQQA